MCYDDYSTYTDDQLNDLYDWMADQCSEGSHYYDEMVKIAQEVLDRHGTRNVRFNN